MSKEKRPAYICTYFRTRVYWPPASIKRVAVNFFLSFSNFFFFPQSRFLRSLLRVDRTRTWEKVKGKGKGKEEKNLHVAGFPDLKTNYYIITNVLTNLRG